MIERQNHLDCREHLTYRREVCRDAEGTREQILADVAADVAVLSEMVA